MDPLIRTATRSSSRPEFKWNSLESQWRIPYWGFFNSQSTLIFFTSFSRAESLWRCTVDTDIEVSFNWPPLWVTMQDCIINCLRIDNPHRSAVGVVISDNLFAETWRATVSSFFFFLLVDGMNKSSSAERSSAVVLSRISRIYSSFSVNCDADDGVLRFSKSNILFLRCWRSI